MTIPVVPEQDPGQNPISLPPIYSPYSGTWWTSQTITNIPAESVGWLVAQGWQITDISYDSATTPPTPYYTLYRESLQNWIVLQNLLNSYTIASNEARGANEVRYNEVVTSWTEMLDSSQEQYEAQILDQNAEVALYLSNLDEYMTEINGLIDDNQTQIVADALTATTALAEMDAKLSALEDNVADNAVTIGDLLSAQAGYLGSFLSAYTSKLDGLDGQYTSHLSIISNLLNSSISQLSTFITDQDTQLARLESEQASAKANVETLLAGEVASLASHLSQYASKLNRTRRHFADGDRDDSVWRAIFAGIPSLRVCHCVECTRRSW